MRYRSTSMCPSTAVTPSGVEPPCPAAPAFLHVLVPVVKKFGTVPRPSNNFNVSLSFMNVCVLISFYWVFHPSLISQTRRFGTLTRDVLFDPMFTEFPLFHLVTTGKPLVVDVVVS